MGCDVFPNLDDVLRRLRVEVQNRGPSLSGSLDQLFFALAEAFKERLSVNGRHLAALEIVITVVQQRTPPGQFAEITRDGFLRQFIDVPSGFAVRCSSDSAKPRLRGVTS
jgi:hypothetical protein